MSHEVERMAYVGAVPWHGLGASLSRGADMETWRRESGLGWKVERSPVQFRPTSGPHMTNMASYTGRDVLYRGDTGAPLSVVSGGYQIVQPGTVLEFFRKVADSAGLELETAGCLRGGAVYWALARTGLETKSVNGDRFDSFVLIATSVDKSLATVARHTSTRVVCANTLEVATGASGGLRVPHSTAFDADVARRELGLDSLRDDWAVFEDTMARLRATPVNPQTATLFFQAMLRPGMLATPTSKQVADGAETLSAMLSRKGCQDALAAKGPARGLPALLKSYTDAPGATPGNAFGLLNGVTHYLDHTRGSDTDKRLASSWFGQGRALKSRTLDSALAL